MSLPSEDSLSGRTSARVGVIALLFAAGLINFFDRSSLGIAATSIRSELGFSETQIGALLSVFSFSYGLAQLPLAGWLRPCNARRTLGLGLLLWSAAQAAAGAVHRFGSFVALRVGLGAGESPFYPAGVFLVRQNTPSGSRGRATAILNMSSTIGLAVAPPLLTALLLHIGWRGMFFALGAAGAVLAVVWLLLPGEAQPSVPVHGEARLKFLKLLRHRTMWGMMLGFGGVNYVNWFYISWLPGYLETGRHLSLRSSGWLAAAPFVAGAGGALLSGTLTDALVRRGAHPTTMLRRLIVCGLVASGVATACVESNRTVHGAVLLICAAYFCLQFAGTAGWSFVQAIAPRDNVPAATALQNFGSFMLASLAPVITGALLDRTHSFGLALLLCGAMAGFGALCYATLTQHPMQAEKEFSQESRS